MKKLRHILKLTCLSSATLCFVLLLVCGAVYFWYTHRRLPDAIQDQALFEGITYTREIRHEPRSMIIHVVKIDLDAPGIGFFVTPGDDIDGFVYEARTVGAFLNEFDVQLAVNGDFFDPWRDYGPWDYYPHSGDGVNVRGKTVSQGVLVSAGYSRFAPTIYFSEDNHVSIGTPLEELYNAISGNEIILQNGQYRYEGGTESSMLDPHPRTALALDETERILLIVVVDGRQPNYSEGVTTSELAQIILDYGGYTALNMDGGGSSTLVIEGENGEPVQLGSAIHTRIPGRQRPVANHLGVFANRLQN